MEISLTDCLCGSSSLENDGSSLEHDHRLWQGAAEMHVAAVLLRQETLREPARCAVVRELRVSEEA